MADVTLAEAWLRYAVARDELEPGGSWQDMRALRPLLDELDRLRAVCHECSGKRK